MDDKMKHDMEREAQWLTAILFGAVTTIWAFHVFPTAAGHSLWIPLVSSGLTIASFIRWQLLKLEKYRGEK